jgi:hypothetical protein
MRDSTLFSAILFVILTGSVSTAAGTPSSSDTSTAKIKQAPSALDSAMAEIDSLRKTADSLRSGTTNLKVLLADSSKTIKSLKHMIWETNLLPTVVFDFLTKNTSGLDAVSDLSQGSFYRIEVTNLNQNLYNVSIKTRDTTFKSQPLSIPGITGVNYDSIESIVKSMSPASLASIVEPSLSKIGTTTTSSVMPVPDSVKAANIEKDNEETISNLLYNSLPQYQNRLDSILFYCDSYKLRSLVADTTTEFYRQFPTTSPLVADGAYSAIGTIRSGLETLYSQTGTKYMDYQSNVLSLAEAISSDSTLKHEDQKIRNSYETLLSTIQSTSAGLSPDTVYKYISSLISFENNSSYNYISLPIQFLGDQETDSITITPTSSNLNPQTFSTQFTFPTNGHFFAGVSVGAYVSNLKDEAYSTQTTISQGDTTYQLVAEKPGDEIGLNSMLNLGNDFFGASDVYWQVGFGAAASITNIIRPRFLFNVGFGFGRKDLILVSVGGIAGDFNVLSSAYKVNQSYTTAPQSAVVSQLKAGCFISLSYLFLQQR